MVFLVESLEKENGTQIIVFSRDSEGKKRIEYIDNFRPYFYVLEDNEVPDDYRIVAIETGYRGIDNTKLKKIICRSSKDIRDLRTKFAKTYESDILFAHRYIIDKIGEVATYPLRVLYFDIEVASKDTFPNMKVPDKPIVTISVIDSFTNEDITFYYESALCKNEVKKSEKIKKYKTEEEMITGFVNYVVDRDPDIITGWNSISFDLTYLIRRMEVLGINYKRLSPLDSVYIDDDREDVIVKGRIIFDLMRGYEFFRRISNQGRAESYSLEFISQEVLKKGKLEHEKFFYDMWINDPKRLIEYNKRDTLLVKEINDKFKILDFFNTIRAKSCANFKDIYHSSVLIDGLILSRTRGNPVLPCTNKDNEEESYSGAIVFKPKPGIYNNLLVLDVKGLYPNIIKTFNISYETLSSSGSIKVSDNISFSDEEGILPKIVRYLEKERNKYKELMKTAYKDNKLEEGQLYNFMQYAVKVLTNSIYGYLGFVRSRLYKKEIAESITTIGRRIITWTKKVAENSGYEVVYGDTDSIIVQSKNSNLFKLIEEGKQLSRVITNSYKDFSSSLGSKICTLEIQFEKILKSCIFVSKKGEDEGAKKKYAYICLWKEDKKVTNEVEFTGFDSVRSDSPRISREVQMKVISMILKGKSRDDVINYIKEVYKKIKNREVPDSDIGFPKGITKDLSEYGKRKEVLGVEYVGSTLKQVKKEEKIGVPPAIRASIYSNTYLNTNFTRGSKPKWIYVKKSPDHLPKIDVIAYETTIPEGFIPDYELLTERIFNMKLSSIFSSVGWGELPDLEEKPTLSTYF